MNFMDIVRSEKAKQAAVAGETETSTVAVVLTDRDIPPGMPRTNRLDNKMTTAQARWALENGDAWIAYLKANGGEIYKSTTLVPPIEVSDAEKYKAICEVLNRVWLAVDG